MGKKRTLRSRKSTATSQQSGLSPDEVNQKLDSYVLRNNKTGIIQRVVFPHGVQVGLNDSRYRSQTTLLGQTIFEEGQRLLASNYINWGDTSGATGYGFRESGGIIQVKNSGANSWSSVGTVNGSGATSNIALWSDSDTLFSDSNLSFSSTSAMLGISGRVSASLGLSGSLTRLVDGTSYLAAGTNITITSESNGQITIAAAGGSGSPGGSDKQVQFNDGGSFGGNAGLLYNKTSNDLYCDGIITASLGLTGSLTRLIDGTSYIAAGTGITIISASNGQITVTSTDTGDITEVTAGTGLAGGGQSGNVSLAIDDSVVATISGSTFTGAVKFNQGLSGSLTRLADSTSYLAAGTNVTITSASNGQVTIASSGGSGMTSFALAGDSGSPQTINDGNTLSVLGGLGTSTDASATDTLTVNIDYAGADNFIEGHTGTGTPASGDKILFSDIDDDNVKKCTVSQLLAGAAGSGDYQAKSANFTVGTSEYIFGITTSGGHLTGTLPAAASAGAGKQYIFKDSGGYAGNTLKGIHIATDSNSEKIDNADAANILVNSGSITVMTDGSDWFVIGVS